MENKELFIKRFLEETLATLSDKEYQIRVWVNAEGPECDSYDEAINDFFYCYRHIMRNKTLFKLTHEKCEAPIEVEKRIRNFQVNAPAFAHEREIDRRGF